MQSKRIDNHVIVRIDKGEELVVSLTEVCKHHNIKAGMITGIGATDKATIGLFNVYTHPRIGMLAGCCRFWLLEVVSHALRIPLARFSLL